MSAEIEPAAEIVSAVLAARAVEPEAGEASQVAASRCLNCGAALTGRYCRDCGQSASIHRSLGAFWHDFLHSVLHFDGKLWRTLPLLVLHPGQLTARYAHGERARFLSPLALFLFSAFVLFAAVKWLGLPFTPELAVIQDGRTISARQLGPEIQKARAALAAGQQRAASAAQLQQLQQDVQELEEAQRIAGQFTSPEAGAQAIEGNLPGSGLAGRLKAALANRELLLYKLESHAYKYSWALIPISVPFIWAVMAWRRGFNLYDHTVFVTYSLCFVSLLLALMSLLSRLGPLRMVSPLLLAAPPVHLFAQLRGAYRLRWPSALWRTLVLTGAAFVSLALFGIALVALDVL